MKNLLRIIGIIALAAVIGFGIIACDGGDVKPCVTHDWEWTLDAIDATCTEASKDTATCKNAGCTATDQRDGSMDALGHEGVGAILPTCQTVGNTGEGICTRCSEILTGVEIPIDPDAHDWDEWLLNAIAATCMAASQDIKTCKNVGCTETIEQTGSVNALGHEGVGAVLATCQKPGNTGVGNCTRAGCGQHVTGNTIPIDPSAHNWNWTANAIAATCMAASIDTATCNNAGCIATNERTGSNPINPSAHNWNWTANTIAATCMAPSKDTATCNNTGCIATNERTGSNPINPSAHNWNWTANTIAATCVVPSKDTASCNNTGCIATNERTGSNPINPSAHNWNWTANTIAATCMAASKDTATCNNIGCIQTNERTGNISALGHNWGAWQETRAATCTVANEQTRTCIRSCGLAGHTETRSTTPAQGHSFKWIVTNTTYPAQSTETCTRCSITGEIRTTQIGDTGPGGGIIFYVADGGGSPARNPFIVPASPDGYTPAWTAYTAYYLEAAPVDISGTQLWASENHLIPNLSSMDETDWIIGRGRLNTALIIAHGAANSYTTPAASACRDLAGDDWFLPSRNELNELYKLYEENGRNFYGNLTDGVYWSSSQFNSMYAWGHVFVIDYEVDRPKGSDDSVRAVRAF